MHGRADDVARRVKVSMSMTILPSATSIILNHKIIGEDLPLSLGEEANEVSFVVITLIRLLIGAIRAHLPPHATAYLDLLAGFDIKGNVA